MKDWEAIVVNGGSTPIPTTFTVTMETVQDGGPLCPVHCETVSSYVSRPVAVTELLTEREREREREREKLVKASLLKHKCSRLLYNDSQKLNGQ